MVVVLGDIALGYVGSYVGLSRYSWALFSETGEDGFFLVPATIDAMTRSEGLLRLNAALLVFYYPAWAVDYYALGGPHWAHVPLGGLVLPEGEPPRIRLDCSKVTETLPTR